MSKVCYFCGTEIKRATKRNKFATVSFDGDSFDIFFCTKACLRIWAESAKWRAGVPR